MCACEKRTQTVKKKSLKNGFRHFWAKVYAQAEVKHTFILSDLITLID